MTRARHTRLARLEQAATRGIRADNPLISAMRGMGVPICESWPPRPEYVAAWEADVAPRQAALLARDPLATARGDE